MRPRPLNPALGDVFHVGDALAAGISRKRLRASDLLKPFHAVRATVGQSAVDSYLPLMRAGDRFSHTTAAQLWGCPVPWTHEEELHVSAAVGAKPRSKGCMGHVIAGIATCRGRYPVSDPAQLVIECGSMLELDELVAIVDHLILDPRVLDPRDLRPHATVEELAGRMRGSRARGVALARRALALSRPGCESPMETRLRLMLRRASLPEPVCGYELCRLDGHSVGWFDLAWPDYKVIAEYDGDQHRTSTTQYDKDIRRFDEAAALGWRVVRVRASGIRNPADTIQRVRDALTRR